MPSQHLNFISSTIKVLKIMLINKITWHYLSQAWGTYSRDLQNIPSQPILLTPFFPSSSSHHPKWYQQLFWKQLDLPKQAIRPDISILHTPCQELGNTVILCPSMCECVHKCMYLCIVCTLTHMAILLEKKPLLGKILKYIFKVACIHYIGKMSGLPSISQHSYS